MIQVYISIILEKLDLILYFVTKMCDYKNTIHPFIPKTTRKAYAETKGKQKIVVY